MVEHLGHGDVASVERVVNGDEGVSVDGHQLQRAQVARHHVRARLVPGIPSQLQTYDKHIIIGVYFVITDPE